MTMNNEEKEITTENENIFDNNQVESPTNELMDIVGVDPAREGDVTAVTEINANENLAESVEEPIQPSEILTTDLYRDEVFESSLEGLTFIELFNLGTKMKNEVEEMKAARESIEGLLKLDKDISKEVSSAATDAKYNDQKVAMEKFLDEYPEMLATYLYRMQVLEARLSEYKDQSNSTVFLTEQLIATVDKKLAEIELVDEEKYLNKDLDIKRLNVRKEALKSRCDLSFIESKTAIPAIVKKMIRESYNTKLFSNIVKDLERMFGPNKFREFLVQLNMFNVVIGENPDDDPKEIMDDHKWLPACNGFLYHMSKLMVNGDRDGSYIYPKLLFMNLIDIKNGIFDLPGGKEEYIERLKVIITKYAELI